eukprot:TRINITY_DN19642_c0_g1_i1.p1 TRINITY_DN19642_c0_g1~~TRINITY_DN19642_c0_g1_i1.p1  ORF type:complete len:581 (+),score=127.20 TRINITY_DN19642_c0_g1_i1:51-1793(+)
MAAPLRGALLLAASRRQQARCLHDCHGGKEAALQSVRRAAPTGRPPARNFPGMRLRGLDEDGEGLKVWRMPSKEWEGIATDIRELNDKNDGEDAVRANLVKEAMDKARPIVSKQGRRGTTNSHAVQRLVHEMDKQVAEWGLHDTGTGQRALPALITFYCMVSQYELAVKVEAAAQERQILTPSLVRARLRLHASRNDPVAAFRVIAEVRKTGTPRLYLKGSGDAVLQVVGSCPGIYNQYDLVLEVLSDLKYVGDKYSWRGIRSALATAATYEEAQTILAYAHTPSLPSKVWAAAIKACQHDLRSATKMMYTDMKRAGVAPCSRCYAVVMRTAAKCFEYEALTGFFREMLTKGIPLTPQVVCELLLGCAQQAEQKRDVFVLAAEDAFTTALALGMEDDAFLWERMLRVYLKVKDVECGEALLQRHQGLGFAATKRMGIVMKELQGGKHDYAAGQIKNVRRLDPQLCERLPDLLRSRSEARRSSKEREEAAYQAYVGHYGGRRTAELPPTPPSEPVEPAESPPFILDAQGPPRCEHSSRSGGGSGGGGAQPSPPARFTSHTRSAQGSPPRRTTPPFVTSRQP